MTDGSESAQVPTLKTKIHESRVPQVRILQGKWQSDHSLVESLNSAFDSIGLTEAYIAQVKAQGHGFRKALKDSVWGMLEFSGPEMALINSPLLQRLRRIRQLGFSYLTYPTAEHSRFVHTLGIAHVVWSFIAAINRERTGDGLRFSPRVKGFQDFKNLDPLKERELVYAALLHDVGHMPFSHASEAAIGYRPKLFSCGDLPIDDHLTLARLHLGKKNPVSEVISLMIVLSSRFASFYESFDPELARDQDSIRRIACLIAGVTTLTSCPNIQEIISAAAVDADKIDYVARDAQACGIAVGVDVSRIFLGGGIVLADANAYDSRLAKDDWRTLFVVNSSGADTLDEIVQARSALYQRVYLHPVTRTAEALLALALQYNASEGKAVLNADLATVFGLWALDDQELLRRICASTDDSVSGLGSRLLHRRLPKKACAIAAPLTELQTPLQYLFRTIDGSMAHKIKKDIANDFLGRLTLNEISKIDLRALENAISQEAGRLAQILVEGGHGKLVPSEPLQLVVMTPIAAMDEVRTDAMVFQSGELIRTPIVTNVQGQGDARDIFKAVGYVLCDARWREIVLHAARRIIYDLSRAARPQPVDRLLDDRDPNSRLRFQCQTLLELDGVVRRANISSTSAEEITIAAEGAGYFDDAPLLATRTDKHDSDVRDIAEKFRVFDGDWGWRVTKETVAAFIDQFPPALRGEALKMLSAGRQLDQLELSTLVQSAAEAAHDRSGRDLIMVPLSPSSGGGVHADVKGRMPIYVRHASSIQAALSETDEAMIVLVDDNAASGIQSAAQLYALAGVAKEQQPEELANEPQFLSALEAPDLARLKARHFALCVAVGADTAEHRLRNATEILGMANFQGVFRGAEIEPGKEWSGELESFLRKVGRDLIAGHTYKRNYSELTRDDEIQFCNEHCFGYGNFGGLLTTRVNVPASTVTALWQPGSYLGRPWIPLFLRRGLLKELILT
jgi:HD superfamily phosphohydrolase